MKSRLNNLIVIIVASSRTPTGLILKFKQHLILYDDVQYYVRTIYLYKTHILYKKKKIVLDTVVCQYSLTDLKLGVFHIMF